MEKYQQNAKPDYGRRLLINIIDGIAASEPSRPFIYAPRSNTPADGWEAVSYGEIAQAINYVAWRIRKTHGPGFQENFTTIAYIGSNDVRYVIIMLACIKAGYQALFLSPRNNREAQVSLLDATECRIVWYSDSFGPLVQTWISQRQIETAIIPSINSLLGCNSEPFPYDRSFDEGQWDPAVVLHTSGSTGTPKPVVMKQGSFAIVDSFRNVHKLHSDKFIFQAFAERANRFFLPMPLSHAAGLMFLFSISVLYETPIALGFPDSPLTADLAIECLKHADAQGALLPPVVLEEISNSYDGTKVLAKLNYVTIGGGNIGQSAGQALVDSGVVISNLIASTEYCPYPLHFHSDMENWQYFNFNSKVMGCDWRLFSKDDNTYELVVRRNDPSGPAQQAAFYTFPHLDEWSTKDLYKPHPTLPDYWMFSGRVDDILVLSNGEKLNPVTMEEMIVGHPSVKGALVVGEGRFQPSLILEPTSPCDDEKTAKDIIDEVWPLIKRVNAETVAHGHIVKWLVTVARQGKAFMRTPKSTVLRKKTVKLFQEEIDFLYDKQQVDCGDEAVDLDLTNEVTLTRSIVDFITNMTESQHLEVDTDFFSVGLDSLKVISVVRTLRVGLESAGQCLGSQLTPAIIYQNPTASQLAKCVYSAIRRHGSIPDIYDQDEMKVSEELLAKYTKDLPSPNITKPPPVNDGQTIIVTGTTGSLGAYLLDRLCKLDNVHKVIALNRDQDGGLSRQPSICTARGLCADFSKVEFLSADLSLPDFGLGQAKQRELLQTVDRVIHNAWPVNFNITVKSFEPHIKGVRHLVEFSAAATKLVPIIFLSTIGTALAWTHKKPVPESRLGDLALAQMGYGQSKLIGSLILDAAAKHGIPATSIRIGQIAGPKSKKGAWNRQEFIPSLIASSVHLGALPTHLGPLQVVDWIPIEDVAGIILDISGVTVEVPIADISGYFHAVNPVTVEWSDLIPAIKNYYSDTIKEFTTFEDWVARLERSVHTTTDMRKNPGIKLLDTYRSMLATHQSGQERVHFSMQRTKTRSPTVKCITGISPSLIINWCDQWEF